jgi:Protein of unknown function (DUF1091)
MTLTVNPTYGNANFSYYDLDGKQYIDVAVHLLKELRHRVTVYIKSKVLCFCFNLNFQLQITFKISRIENGKKRKILAVPKANFCEFLSSMSHIPIISSVAKSTMKYGYTRMQCPFAPSVYFVKQFPTKFAGEDLLLPRGLYYSMVEMFDENVKSVEVLKLEIDS